ncbi:GNAT family N-acetyltransferase [Kribbella sp. DT2]|uniref:GNAT family N-acetyltransferase n=1 Tax=Kribbella sp. DT2 TaxID=3393427 RepID=UPI003CE70BEE
MADIEVRRATPDDAEALVRLRGLMLDAMGTDVGDENAPWRAVALRYFTEQLPATERFATFVVDDPAAGVVAGATGHLNSHAPGPNDLSVARGTLYNVSTDPEFRRRGLARACVIALLDWFRDETPAGQIELHATQYGDQLYRSLGFVESRYPAQRLRITR